MSEDLALTLSTERLTNLGLTPRLCGLGMRQWNETRSKEAALTSVSSQHKVDIGTKPNVKFSMAHEVSHHHFLNHSNFCFLLLMCVCVKEGGRRGREGRGDRHLQNYKLDS